jgi:hypothetical protein
LNGTVWVPPPIPAALQGTWKQTDTSGYTFSTDGYEAFNASGITTYTYKVYAWTSVTSGTWGTSYILMRLETTTGGADYTPVAFHIGTSGTSFKINSSAIEYTKQ